MSVCAHVVSPSHMSCLLTLRDFRVSITPNEAAQGKKRTHKKISCYSPLLEKKKRKSGGKINQFREQRRPGCFHHVFVLCLYSNPFALFFPLCSPSVKFSRVSVSGRAPDPRHKGERICWKHSPKNIKDGILSLRCFPEALRPGLNSHLFPTRVKALFVSCSWSPHSFTVFRTCRMNNNNNSITARSLNIT